MTEPTAPTQPPPPTAAQTKLIADFSDDLATAMGNVDPRQRDNMLTRMIADPMTELANYGLDATFFANALPDVKAEFASFLKAEAAAALNEASSGRAKRDYHWFRCMACRIGIGAAIVAAGLAISFVTAGPGGIVFAWIVAQVAVRAAITLAAATALVGGTIVVGSFVGAGVVGTLIELVCEAIPDTCV